MLKGTNNYPKIFREKYGIKEKGYVIVEARENELAILRAPRINEALAWIRQRRRRLKAKQAKLGDLEEVDLI